MPAEGNYATSGDLRARERRFSCLGGYKRKPRRPNVSKTGAGLLGSKGVLVLMATGQRENRLAAIRRYFRFEFFDFVY
jgi:hypothetical protein